MATLYGGDMGPGRRGYTIRLGKAQGMKASEFVHHASLAGPIFL